MALAVGIGLGLLAFFKYFNYAAEALVALGRLAGLGAVRPLHLEVALPLGLHTLSRGSSVLGQLAWFVVVQVTVLVAWVFFRSADIATATGLLANLVGGQYGKLPPSVPVVMLGLVALPPLAGHLRTLLRERFGVPDLSVMEKAVWGAGMLYASLTAYGPTTTFIYFQF